MTMNIKAPITVLFACSLLTGCSDGDVYICTGPQSEAYHKSDDCKGLRRCSGTIEKISKEDAKFIGRRACRFCY